MMGMAGRSARRTLLLLAMTTLAAAGAEAAVKPRVVLLVPFDATGLERD